MEIKMITAAMPQRKNFLFINNSYLSVKLSLKRISYKLLENSITIFASKFGWFCCVQYHPNDYANFCQPDQLGWIERTDIVQ